MGQLQSSQEDDDAIPQVLQKANNNQPLQSNNKKQEQITVLLLGPGESGKSTLFKQIQYLYNQGIALETKRKALKDVVYSNIIENMRSLIEATHMYNWPIENSENREIAHLISDSNLKIEELEDIGWAERIERLWNDKGIQTAITNAEKFQIYDSATYLFENIRRLCCQGYTPTVEDLIHTRIKTLGINDVTFSLAENNNINNTNGRTLRLVDVGGQRNERKKWLHLFSEVNAIVFMISLSEFDLTCYEATDTKRLEESRTVLESIANNSLFQDTPFVLLFNKVDILEQKLQKKSFKNYFPEFQGNETNSTMKEKILL
ncbi:hypothetical protein ABK040_004337 [Willaertia magna]